MNSRIQPVLKILLLALVGASVFAAQASAAINISSPISIFGPDTIQDLGAPTSVIDATGKTSFFYWDAASGDNNVVLKLMQKTGPGSFGPSVNITSVADNAQMGGDVVATVDKNNNVHVVWTDPSQILVNLLTPGNSVQYVKIASDGSIQNRQTLQPAVSHIKIDYLSIAVRSSTDTTVAWNMYDMDSGYRSAKYAQVSGGSHVTNDLSLQGTSILPGPVALASDKTSDNIVVALPVLDQPLDAVACLEVSTISQGLQGPIQRVSCDTTMPPVSAAKDGLGSTYIAYAKDQTNGAVAYRKLASSGTLSGENLLADKLAPQDFVMFLKAFALPNNSVMFVWSDVDPAGGLGKISIFARKVSRFGGLGSKTTLVQQAPVPDSLNDPVDAAMDSDGNVIASWTQGFAPFNSAARVIAATYLNSTGSAIATTPLASGLVTNGDYTQFRNVGVIAGNGAAGIYYTMQDDVIQRQYYFSDVSIGGLSVHSLSVSTRPDQPVEIQLNRTPEINAEYQVDVTPKNGTLGPIDSDTGLVTYTPVHGFMNGVDQFTYHAFNSYGVSASQVVTVSVSEGIVITPPLVTKLRFVSKGRKSKKASSMRLSFSLDQQASLNVVAYKLSKGKKISKQKCVKKTAKNAKKKNCTLTKQVWSKKIKAGKVGKNTVTLSKRTVAKKFKRGKYRFVVTATNGNGNSQPKTKTITLKKARK